MKNRETIIQMKNSQLINGKCLEELIINLNLRGIV